MAEWVKIDWKDLPPPEPYKMRPHHPVKVRFLPWLVCAKCGLIFIRNLLTEWCDGKGCDSDIHPDYKRKVRELSKQKGL